MPKYVSENIILVFFVATGIYSFFETWLTYKQNAHIFPESVSSSWFIHSCFILAFHLQIDNSHNKRKKELWQKPLNQ